MKEYNLKRHYETKHAAKFDGIEGQMRVDKVEALKKQLQLQQYTFQRPNIESEACLKRLGCVGSSKGQKMDFSIFYEQNSSLQRKPVEFTKDFQVRPNLGLSLKPNRQSYQQNKQLQQQESLRNNNFLIKSNSPQINNNTSNSTLLMEPPQRNQWFSKTRQSAPSSVSVASREDTRQNVSEISPRVKRYGETDSEKMCIFTGTVERVIKWGKIFQNHFCYFEVVAGVVSIADGKVQFEKIMLLRDKKGPILQVTYYSNATHINIDDFHLGQMLRAVGRMIGPNIMSAITIRAATTEEIESLPRMCYVSDHAVSSLCGNSSLLKY